MKQHDSQSIELAVTPERAFAYIADAERLPEWTHAFAEVEGTRALLRTPNGEVEIELQVLANAATGTVDWRMVFPDGAAADAFSRVTPLGSARCVYSFVLTPPPVPLEQLEGALEEQSRTLTEELGELKRLLESRVGS